MNGEPHNNCNLLKFAKAINFLLTRFFAFLLTFYLIGCANPIAPTGGPKDETPPKLDTQNSTRNMQIRFEKKDIVLTFDEWVELKDAFNQVVVSPPLEFRPTIERKKKAIHFKFNEKEKLRDSATYVVNFGEAIKDLTEGNVAPIVFVFSTGDFIDSLSVEGEVMDAYTAEPVKDVLFMLYENLADSVFHTDRPFYFARTDESGKFKVSNMKSGKFKAVALIDENLNYRFDNEAEKIAFLDSAIILNGVEKIKIDSTSELLDSINIDSTKFDYSLANQQPSTNNKKQSITLKLFEEEKQLYLRDDDAATYGKVKLTFNRDPYDAVVAFDSIGQFTFLEKELDTLAFWYAMETEMPFNIYVQRDTSVDTVEVGSGLRKSFLEKAKLRPEKKNPSNSSVLTPENAFEWMFNHPISGFGKSMVTLFEDSVKTSALVELGIDSIQKRKLKVEAKWKEGLRYELEILPGGLIDIFGLSNEDTLRADWNVGLEKDFGTLTLRVNDLLPDTSYVIRLLAKNESLFKEFKISGASVFEAKLKFLPPDTYSVEIIEDLDANGRWTTGNYDLKRQPERVHRATIEEVRANWEVDAEVRFNPLSKARSPAPPASSPQTPERGR